MFHSIIIPTHNRCSSLKNTLLSLQKAGKGLSYEVVVIDNGSTDDTAAVCSEVQEGFHQFIYRYDATPGLLTGRHLGAQLARGEVLSFLDDDVEVSEGWVGAVQHAFRTSTFQMVTGPSVPAYQSEPPAWLEALWEPSPYGGKQCTWLSLLNLGDKEREIDPLYVWGLNFSIRKDCLFKLGGFHPDNIPARWQQFGGDGETGLALKCREAGYKALYVPGAGVKHFVSSERLTLAYMNKRAYYQGVCDSYTQIRARLLKKEATLSDHSFGQRLLLKARRAAQRLGVVSEKKEAMAPAAYGDLKAELQKSHQAGYNFHQQAFAQNPEVQQWVRKENYWNYKLPLND